MSDPSSSSADPQWTRNGRLRSARVVMRPGAIAPVVEVPGFWLESDVAEFLTRNRRRIAASMERVMNQHRERQERFGPRSGPPLLPDELSLPAVGELWTITTSPDPAMVNRKGSPRLKVCRQTRRLEFLGPGWTEGSRLGTLKLWLRSHAAAHLEPLTFELGRKHGLPPKAVRIRSQRTRWGSCSVKGTVSLNCAMLCLTPDLVEYVIVHELAHLRHMNHSHAFHEFLSELLPDAEPRRQRLRAAERQLPGWLSSLLHA